MFIVNIPGVYTKRFEKLNHAIEAFKKYMKNSYFVGHIQYATRLQPIMTTRPRPRKNFIKLDDKGIFYLHVKYRGKT